jgi:hypothetical protein
MLPKIKNKTPSPTDSKTKFTVTAFFLTRPNTLEKDLSETHASPKLQ